MKTGEKLDCMNSAFPTFGQMVTTEIVQPAFSTLFGYVLAGQMNYDKLNINAGLFFSLPSMSDKKITVVNGAAFIVCRFGYLGASSVGWGVNGPGRLSYIDGCSASILVYPPRLGEPSLHHLHFPKETSQSWHLHPSIRMGVVIRGSGTACLKGKKIPLVAGSTFALDPMETHRFETGVEPMDLIAFHPDGDWGPEDENHPMLNRTFLRGANGKLL